jgi:quinol-cytochrome oxidoreductase complex cytochrome b subunit
MINPINFIPKPSSTLSEWQQYQDYENSKAMANAFAFWFPLIIIVTTIIVFIILWLTTREAKKTYKELAFTSLTVTGEAWKEESNNGK